MITPQQAIAAYPALAGLFAIIQLAPAWVFNTKIVDGNVEALSGARVWPDHTVDQIGIRGESDAAARRTNPLRETVWSVEGTVADVTARVIAELLAPNHPLAPRGSLAHFVAVVNGFGTGRSA
jgi:hypothetical protein